MTRQVLSEEDWKSIQQPLDKDGWSNDTFDKLYGRKTKNPYHGTERDRKKRRGTKMVSISAEDWERIFGKHKK